MAEPRFPADDDLPRTFRREREAREREARERDGGLNGNNLGGMGPAAGPGGHDYGPPPQDYGAGSADNLFNAGASGTVTRFEVPFLHLVGFFLKAVLAAIPALILLTVLLFAGGWVLKQFAPSFRHFEIIVKSVESPPVAATVPPLPAKNPPAKK